MKRKTRIRPRRRAGALAFALIITACLAICAGAVLSLSGSEHKLTLRRILVCEARNAAESTLNYGVSQIVRMTSTGTLVTEDFFKANPLQVPADGKLGSGGLAQIHASELMGGRALVINSTVRISTTSPTAITDEAKGHALYIKTIPLLTTVVATAPGGSPITVYAKADLVIRDDPLFNYAVFYNNIPLEIGPGAEMTISGDVRANSDIYLGGGGGKLNIAGTINTAGSIHGGRNSASGKTGSGSNIYVAYSDSKNDGFDNITGWTYDETRIKNGQKAAYTPNDKAELISLTFKDEDGNSHFLDNALADWKTLATTITNGNMQDAAHGISKTMPPGISSEQGADIIQPPVAGTTANPDIEGAKYSNKAGLYLVVEPGGAVTAFQNATDAGAYKTAEDRADWKTTNPGKILDLTDTKIVGTGKFNDARENKTVTSVDLNIEKLRNYIAGKSPDGTSAITPAFIDKTSYPLDNQDLKTPKGWNGVVYVDVENPKASLTNPTDQTALTAVRITDASQVPSRAGTGFTLATNAPMYTVGNVNSDGKYDTGTNTKPDTGNTAALGTECPVNLAADAITTLSSNWKDDGTSTTPGFTEISAALTVGVVKTGTYDSNGNLTGKSYSGGLENFPRLLEHWASDKEKALRIRGSMTALYESRYATGKWGTSNYYSIPYRDWGFSRIFADGMYPPGTPIIRSYRRINFRLLSSDQYRAEKAVTSTWTKPDKSTAPKFHW